MPLHHLPDWPQLPSPAHTPFLPIHGFIHLIPRLPHGFLPEVASPQNNTLLPCLRRQYHWVGRCFQEGQRQREVVGGWSFCAAEVRPFWRSVSLHLETWKCRSRALGCVRKDLARSTWGPSQHPLGAGPTVARAGQEEDARQQGLFPAVPGVGAGGVVRSFRKTFCPPEGLKTSYCPQWRTRSRCPAPHGLVMALVASSSIRYLPL